MAGFKEAYALIGPGFSANIDMPATGLREAIYFHVKDGKGVVDRFTKLFQALKMPGVSIRGPESASIDGLDVAEFHVDFDSKAIVAMIGDKTAAVPAPDLDKLMTRILGSGALRVAYAVKDEELVQVIGGDDAYLHRSIAAMSAGGHKLPSDVQSMLERMSASNPCMVGQVDFARYLEAIMDVMAVMVPEGQAPKKLSLPSTPSLFYFGIDGRVWRGGESFDLARVASAVQQISKQSPTPAKAAGAKQGKAKADIRAIDSASKDYAIQHGGNYPESLEALVTEDANGHAYLEGKKVPRDPWGREYKYDAPTKEHPEPRVYTYGRDGKPGGTGDDADIDNSMVHGAKDADDDH
jgi:general secretion pathway protein G